MTLDQKSHLQVIIQPFDDRRPSRYLKTTFYINIIFKEIFAKSLCVRAANTNVDEEEFKVTSNLIWKMYIF